MDREGTARAVGMQLAAMGHHRFEVGMRNVEKGTMWLRTWGLGEIQQKTAWLTWINGRGNDVYIRPDGSVGLILVDDLTAHALTQMADDGLAPAVVVETSPWNHQAWVRLSQKPISAALATTAAKILARRYGGDPASADWRHFGRLAGFANLKPERREADGTQPYAILHEANGLLALRAEAFLIEADVAMRKPAESSTIQRPLLPHHDLNLWPPGEAYNWYAERMTRRNPEPDPSRLDWMVLCCIASANGAVDHSYLAQALLDGSPNLEQRKRGHLEHYVSHTAAKVLADSHVLAARRELTARSL